MILTYVKQIWEKTRHSRPVIVSAALLFVILIGYKIVASFTVSILPIETKVVEVETAALHNIAVTARFIGTVRAHHSTTLIAKATGTLDSLLNAGQWVKKGTLIARVDNADIEKSYELSVAAENIAQDQYNRILNLEKKGASSKAAVEEKKHALIGAQKSLAEAKIALDKIYFYAPFDGVIGVFKAREGAQVQEADPIVSLYDMASLIVEFDIPASLSLAIKDHQPIQINGKVYPLTHVQKMIDEETGACPAYVTYPCNDCLIGATVDVDLVIEQHTDVIVLPFDAIVFKDGNIFVYLVKGGKATLIPVTLGLREKDKIEVTEGVAVGDQVIVAGQSRLYPEIAVTVHQEK
ncbi:efflux RND transporter periplasmic adaptor subunit [Candidatus Paracaedibacter symbiosus]|uniref:efflux RND transporter periplasmic adaptor subunit n=1 Tax=Candidatus Paracaedibacter symbiosus TaxID=244582 RepID=UPI00068FEF73|nr:efflux RND transporter periplasmic adaptor subunit [Candidatus Paracaedibacter symbiosus]